MFPRYISEYAIALDDDLQFPVQSSTHKSLFVSGKRSKLHLKLYYTVDMINLFPAFFLIFHLEFLLEVLPIYSGVSTGVSTDIFSRDFFRIYTSS